jgi:hypothetical protein
MTKSDFHQKLLTSENFAQYSLRASFFLRKLRGMRLWEAIEQVQQLPAVASGFPWDLRNAWGIDESAWLEIERVGIHPLLLFCHPRVLSEQPHLLLYYRTVALISQKGLASLVGGNIAKIESGPSPRIEPEFAKQVAIALNSIVSSLVETAAELRVEYLSGLQFASAGATIQGSWNNAVGAEGEAVVRTLLVNHLQSEIAQVVFRSTGTLEYTAATHQEVLDRIADIKVIRLKQGFHLVFSSEPDISLRNPNDLPLVAVEIKAGTDSAGALERLGAAMKSFENERNLNPRVKTVYIVRCMTPEVQTRISQTNPFDFTFGLSQLLHDEKTQRTFANLLLRTVLEQ